MSSHIDITTRMAAIRNCLRQKKSRVYPPKAAPQATRVHMLGVCGVGMAGLALLLKKQGFKVSGCDLALNPLAAWLKQHGIPVYAGHAAGHVRQADWLIKSTAVTDNDPELKAARQAGRPVFQRGMVLAEMTSNSDSICVCGTHGKTTTTAMIAQVLKAAGKQPSFCIGGEVKPPKAAPEATKAPALGGVAGVGTGKHIVVEADESDGTLAWYKPALAVITNIEFDHAEYFPNFSELEKCFRQLADRTRGKIIYCYDNQAARRMLRGRPNAWSYGFTKGADLRLINLRENSAGLSVSLKIGPQRLGKISLPIPGRHNALNAAAACAVGLELGVPFAKIAGALKKFQPVARRFEKIVDTKDLLVIADYAHHPSEIAALMNSVQALKKRRWLAVFQPHRYSRTKALGKFFPPAFRGMAELVLCPVYAASEKPLAGGLSADLYGHFRKYGKINAHYATALPQAWDYLKQKISAGDGLLIIGAGDVNKIGEWAKKELSGGKAAIKNPGFPIRSGMTKQCPLIMSFPRKRESSPRHLGSPALGWHCRVILKFPGSRLKNSSIKLHEPLASKTTLRVGGPADIFIEVGSADDLALLLRWAGKNRVPIKALGAGSNVLASDLGVRGIVLRLKGPVWQTLRLEKNGRVVAGAGLSLAKLTDWAARNNLSGVEFLTGIPGTIGGAVRMNAGAFAGEIGAITEWVQVMEPNGRIVKLNRRRLQFAYRACKGLENRIVLAAALKLKKGRRAVVFNKMLSIQRRRKWMRGLRSAGSIFKNPRGNSAGRLIESLGLKGLAIGGARVSKQHANVITAGKDAKASDIISLIEIIRLSVRMKCSVDLEREVEYWE